MCSSALTSLAGNVAGTLFGGPLGGVIGGALGGLVGKKASATAIVNPASEQRQAEVDAINKSNASAAMRRKALRDNSLFTGAGEAGQTSLGVGG